VNLRYLALTLVVSAEPKTDAFFIASHLNSTYLQDVAVKKAYLCKNTKNFFYFAVICRWAEQDTLHFFSTKKGYHWFAQCETVLSEINDTDE